MQTGASIPEQIDRPVVSAAIMTGFAEFLEKFLVPFVHDAGAIDTLSTRLLKFLLRVINVDFPLEQDPTKNALMGNIINLLLKSKIIAPRDFVYGVADYLGTTAVLKPKDSG